MRSAIRGAGSAPCGYSLLANIGLTGLGASGALALGYFTQAHERLLLFCSKHMTS